MKKLSEVCKIVGVTRRTLQEYDKIGLVKPTFKTDSGYWYYDDNAINILFLVKIFIEAGYERKAIKAFIDSPMQDTNQVFIELLNTLEEKKKRIDGMINTVQILHKIINFPSATFDAIQNIDLARVYKNKSFALVFNDAVNSLATYNDAEQKEAELFIPFWYGLIAIGNLIGNPIESIKVKSAFDDVFFSLKKLVLTNDDSHKKTLSFEDKDFAEILLDGTIEMVNDAEMKEAIKLHLTDGATDYIIQVIKYYCDKILNKNQINQKGET